MSWKLKKQQLLLLTYPSPNSQVQIVFSHIIWCKNDCRYTVASQSFAFVPWITVQCPVSFCWHIICLAGLTKNPNVFFSVHCIPYPFIHACSLCSVLYPSLHDIWLGFDTVMHVTIVSHLIPPVSLVNVFPNILYPDPIFTSQWSFPYICVTYLFASNNF